MRLRRVSSILALVCIGVAACGWAQEPPVVYPDAASAPRTGATLKLHPSETEMPPPRWHAWVDYGPARGGSYGVGIAGQAVGISAAWGTRGEFSSDDLLDYDIPHNDYTDLGVQSVDRAWGLDLLGFYTLSGIEAVQVALLGGLGYYSQEYRHIVQSNVTGWYYTQSKTSKPHLAVSLGAQVYLTRSGSSGCFVVGVAYHTVRGVCLRIGFGSRQGLWGASGQGTAAPLGY